MKDRDSHIDNAKGVLITLVLLGHLVWPVPGAGAAADVLYAFLYLFHMPLFVLLAGYLSRAECGVDRVLGDVRRLLVPYAVFAAAQWGVLTALGREVPSLIEGHYGLWFLMSLFCWRVALPWVVRLHAPLLLGVAGALFVGFVPWVGMEFSLSRTVVFFPFFLAGYLLRAAGRSLPGLVPRPLAAGALAAALVCAFFLARWGLAPLLWGAASFAQTGMPFALGPAVRALFLLTGLGVGLSVLTLVPRGPGVLTRIGYHSLYVYLLHGPLLAVYRAVPSWNGWLGGEPLAMILAAPVLAWFLASPPVVRLTRPLVEPWSARPIKRPG